MDNRMRKPTLTESCLVVMVVIAVGFVLSKAAQVAIPFMLAFLFAMLFAPFVIWGTKHKIPPVVMVLVVLASLICVLLPAGLFISARLEGMDDILPGYYSKLVDIGKAVLAQYDIPKDFWISINWYNSIGRYLSNMTGFMLAWTGTLMMVLVFLVFMLLESPYVKNRLKMAFRGESGERISLIADKVVMQISKYLRTLAVISLVTGVCVWVALTAIGIDFAVTWAVLAFFLNFIPTIGSILASIPPILIALVQFYPNWIPSLLTLLSLLTIQFCIGNLVTPKIMGDALDLSPVVILISLLFWGLIWGFSGALLSVPIMVMIKIICENVPELHFVAMLICSAKEEHYAEMLEEKMID